MTRFFHTTTRKQPVQEMRRVEWPSSPHLQLLDREQRHAHAIELSQILHELRVAQLPPEWPPVVACRGNAGTVGRQVRVGGNAKQNAQRFGKRYKTWRQLLQCPATMKCWCKRSNSRTNITDLMRMSAILGTAIFDRETETEGARTVAGADDGRFGLQ